MSGTIKAIDTEYNGYLFRSRLEARWAVFFDAAGIKYEYEKEGYDLGKYGHYLPDFWLPDLSYFVEVKPRKITQSEDNKISSLVIKSGYPVLILHGLPESEADHNYPKFEIDPEVILRFARYGAPSRGEEWWFICDDDPYYFCRCIHCGHVGVAWCGRSHRIECCSENKKTENNVRTATDPLLMSAYGIARKARFEHGQTKTKNQIRAMAINATYQKGKRA